MADNAPGPNLSLYFANDPPSFFDNLAEKGPAPSKPDTAMVSNYSAYDFIQKNSGINVLDHVKDMWEDPLFEPGIPPTLTLPGVSLSTDIQDQISEAVSLLIEGNEVQKRKFLSPDDVTQDERGLRELIDNDCFRSALNLTARLLTIYKQGYGSAGHPVKHSPHSLQIWFTRLALLIKLGHYEACKIEAEPFGTLNRPDVYYEFYPDMYDGKKGSMASFSFRLLLAELPIYLNNVRSALNKLTDLLNVCSEIRSHFEKSTKENSNEAKEFWAKREKRVLHSIINCCLLLKDFSLADQLLKKAIEEMSNTEEEKQALLSASGRIYLQCGDIFGAEKKFAECRKMNGENSEMNLRDLIDKGLIAVAQNDFHEAFTCFQKGLAMDPTNTMLYNNMGVCLLYSGKLKEAIKMYENAIQRNLKTGLNEYLLVNLSTLYELESSNSHDKKVGLLKLINQNKPDLNISLEVCLKLQTVA